MSSLYMKDIFFFVNITENVEIPVYSPLRATGNKCCTQSGRGENGTYVIT